MNKRLLFRVIFTVLWVLLLTIFLLEIVLRISGLAPTRVVNESIYPGLLGDYKPSQNFLSDLIIPHHIKINSQGLRGPEISINKQKDSIRVLVLGDSYTFGSRVSDEEAFPSRLGELLNTRDKKGKKIEVLNGGHGAYSTREEYEYFIERGIYLQPDVLILAWFPNDLTELNRADSWRNLLKGHYKFEPFKSYIRSLALFNVLRVNISYAIINLKFGSYVPKENIDILDTNEPEAEKALWQSCFGYILKFKDVCDKKGIKFWLVALPDLKQFSEPGKFGPQGRLKMFSKTNRINFIDISEIFISASAKEKIGNFYLYPRDCHFSPLGNKIVSQELFNHIGPTIKYDN